MCWREARNNFFPARSTLLLPLLLISLSLQSFAQANPDNKQSGPGTNKTDTKPPEDISRWLSVMLAAQGGGGWSSNPAFSPTAYGGVKLGIPVQLSPGNPPKKLYTFTLDLGYDRIPSHNGFATEVSAVLPVFRFPGPQKDKSKNFLRIYAEPGLGYRAGGGLGGYGSAKVMMVLFSDQRLTSDNKWSPYIEVQRRFPFGSPLQGDNRISFGMMFAMCEHCGPAESRSSRHY